MAMWKRWREGLMPAYAVGQTVLGLGVWAALPGSGSLSVCSVGAAACVLLELVLILRLDRSLRDGQPLPSLSLPSLCVQGLAIAFPWLLTLYLSLKLTFFPDADSALAFSPVAKGCDVALNGSLSSNASLGLSTALSPSLHYVRVDSLGLSLYPGCVLLTSVTQLRVFGLLLMDVLSSLSPLGGKQGTVVYHVEADDSYVMTWEMDKQLAHASYTSLQQVQQLDWQGLVRDVKRWSDVPQWACLRLCGTQPSSG